MKYRDALLPSPLLLLPWRYLSILLVHQARQCTRYGFCTHLPRTQHTGLALYNAHAKAQVLQYALSVSELLKLMVTENREALTRRVSEVCVLAALGSFA